MPRSMLTVDSSAIIEMIFPDADRSYANALSEKFNDFHIIVPQLFFYATTNVLMMQVRRGKSTLPETLRAITHVKQIIDEAVDIADMKDVVMLAQHHTLTIYDASYLSVAKQYNAPLATLDKALKKAALAENLFYNPSL